MAAEQYATAVEYILIAAGFGLLLMATFAPRARNPLAVVFGSGLASTPMF
jgi:hypothetical protein